jgi:hypothetical protein
MGSWEVYKICQLENLKRREHVGNLSLFFSGLFYDAFRLYSIVLIR